MTHCECIDCVFYRITTRCEVHSLEAKDMWEQARRRAVHIGKVYDSATYWGLEPNAQTTGSAPPVPAADRTTIGVLLSGPHHLLAYGSLDVLAQRLLSFPRGVRLQLAVA